MTMHTTLPALTVAEFEGEPRVLDTDLAKALGMANPYKVRAIISGHRESLEAFGPILSRGEKTPGKAGRPGTNHYLNEEQALYVTMHCRTERAEAVKVQLVKVFTAWRRRQLVPAQQAQAIDFTNPLVMAQIVQQQARTVIPQKVAAQEPSGTWRDQ